MAGTKAAPKLVNHIGFVVDRSGSMRRIQKQVVKVFNQQLDRIQANSDTKSQHSFVTEYTFNSSVDKPRYVATPAGKIPHWAAKDFQPGGGTALLDGVGTCVDKLLHVKGAKDKDTSFLVIVITDGAENSSHKYKRSLPSLLKTVQKTGRWSLVFLVPPGGKETLKRYHIPEGNIDTWQNNTAGTKAMAMRVSKGLDNFYTARSSGQKSVKSFFTTDMTKVDTKKLTKNLQDLSKTFSVWPIEKEVGIRDFVNKKLAAASAALQKKVGKEYLKGAGYYELTKPEDVQEYKEVAIMDKATKHIYGGHQARALLGFPPSGVARVTPGNHMNYAIFVESTSTNRKLVRGTRLLYKHP
jgi:hypothetical protein